MESHKSHNVNKKLYDSTGYVRFRGIFQKNHG